MSRSVSRAPCGFLLPLLAGLLFGSVATAAPAGVNLSWDACTSEGGVQSKTFACDTNSSTKTMWGSFVLAADQNDFIGVEITLDIQTQSDSLPNWWRFMNAGACRQNALSVNFLFDTDPGVDCVDPWSGQATGGLGSYHTYWTTPQVPGGKANTARIRIVAALPSTQPMLLAAGTEYYCFKLTLSAARTVGTGSCGGCDVPACILLSQIGTVRGDGTREDLTSPSSVNLLTWQSGEICSAAFVTPNVTWGQIRSVLR